MKLDAVHDLQRVFRKIVRAASFPGEIEETADIAGKIDIDSPCNKAVLLAALTLLDAETTFAVAPRDEAASSFISQLTYAKPAALQEAAFVFALGPAGDAIAGARPGSLIDPHEGATVILETKALFDDGDLTLTGPGLNRPKKFGVAGDDSWVEARREKNAEYPLGVDLIFVDADHRLACLPRTTVVERGA